MIGMGSRLTKLRLADGQERSAQLLHRLYGNKRVYLLPSRDIVSTTNINDYLLPSTDDGKESDTEVRYSTIILLFPGLGFFSVA